MLPVSAVRATLRAEAALAAADTVEGHHALTHEGSGSHRSARYEWRDQVTTLMKAVAVGGAVALSLTLVGCASGNSAREPSVVGSSAAAMPASVPDIVSTPSPSSTVVSAPAGSVLTAKTGVTGNVTLLLISPVPESLGLVLETPRGRRLDLCGYSLALADGQAALDAAATGEFPAVVLDLRTPGLTGPEFITQLRNAGSVMPVVVLARKDDSSTLPSQSSAGGVRILTDESRSHVSSLCAQFMKWTFTGRFG